MARKSQNAVQRKMPNTRPLPLNQFITGDCIEVMRSLPAHSVDVIFADPPYFLQLKEDLSRPDASPVDGVTAQWDKFRDFEHYDSFTQKWLAACRHVLKKDGTIWVIGSYHNIFRVGNALQNMGFWILNDLVWIKSNPMPNFRGTRFTNAHETLLWSSYDQKSRYRFNYRAMKTLNDDLQMRSDWYLPLCTGKERLRDEKQQKIHPTQKPESLLYRVITASTAPGDIILDPFSGTGTTAAVAKKLGRNYIGIERDKTYLSHAKKRLKKIEPLEEESLKLDNPHQQKRIPFGSLIESGLVQPGDILKSPCDRYQAMIRADAQIDSNGYSGSIHKVSAALQNKQSCNGWDFWILYKKNGKSRHLSELRTELRKKIINDSAPIMHQTSGRI
jgi:modification methylase